MNSNDLISKVSFEESSEEGYLSETDEAIGDMASGDVGDSLRAISGSAYNGTIGTTYLEYFNGVIDRLPVGTTYLVYRPDRYDYRIVYGDALTESGGRFSASEANYINVYSYDTTEVTRGTDSVNVTVGNAMVYSNVPGYPNSMKGVTHAEGLAIMALLAIILLFDVVRGLFRIS